jgi:predicted nuclease with TOPRIM domain
MKLKGLEILKEGLEFMEKAIKVNPNSVKELQSEINIYNEAIEELKAVQDIILEKNEALEVERLLFKNKFEEINNRSCESCKTNKVCNIYKILGSNVGLLVSCKKWKIK